MRRRMEFASPAWVVAGWLCALLVCCGEAAGKPVIGPGHEAEILALLEPYTIDQEILAGWHWTGISVPDAIEITLRRGDDAIAFELHDPSWKGDAPYASAHFRIALRTTPNVSASDLHQVGETMAAIIARNDRTDPWYDPDYSAFPRQQPHPVLSRRALLAVGALLVLLIAVAVHGHLTRTRAGPPAERIPTLAPLEWVALLALTAVAAAAFLVPSYLRYVHYGIYSWDIGIYTHAFWNALHGLGLFNSPEGMDHLGSHASPGLYLLLPIYALAPNPFTLLALNGLALASGAIPACLIARRRFPAAISMLCAVVYLVNPALRALNYDVHEISFAVPLFLWALLFLQSRRSVPMLGALSLAMLFKEDVGVSACFVGVYLILFQRRFHLGTAVIFLGLAWVVAGINLIIPYYGGNHAHVIMSRYSALGDDWLELLLSPVRRPSVFFDIVCSRATAEYLASVLSPFAFLPLLAPAELVLAIPPLAQNILSAQIEMRSGAYHYDALVVPALYLAFVVAVARLCALATRLAARSRLVQAARGAGAARLTALLVVVLVVAGHLRGRPPTRGLLRDVDGDPARAEIDAIVAGIPAEVSVVSPQNVQPHLSDRTVSAYLDDATTFSDEHPPFAYAVLPSSITAPPSRYELAWQGTSYCLFRRREP